jgi:DNA-binding NarL/FixJ family response regulator
MSEITVALVDDHPLFRSGVHETLAAEADIEVVGEAASAVDAVRIAKSTSPDVVLLDLGIPGGGLSAAEQIARLCPTTRIIILTASEHEDDVAAALRLGVNAFVVKGVSGPELVRIVRGVSQGDVYVSPHLAASMLMHAGGSGRSGAPANSVDDLSKREEQVLALVADAYSNKEIASRLAISDKTVKHHMTNIMEKLQARNRVEAAMIYRKRRPSKEPREI